MNEELLGLLGATPEQIAQARRRSGYEELSLLGQALMQAGAPAPRGTSTLSRLGQAAGMYTQAPRQTMDTLLQDLYRRQQLQEMQKKRQQETLRQQQLETFIGGLPPEEQARFRAFPDQAAQAMFREQKAPPGVVGEFTAAKEAGLISPTTTLEQFVAMKKPPPATTSVTNIVGGEKLSPGQIEQDKDFGKQINEWKMGGGQDMSAQIAQLKPVIEALESGQPITGVSVAIQPDILLAMTNPKALQSRELVEEVVQRNLRTILGSQFTAQEGERLIARAFNPKLKPEENAKRVRRLFLQMSAAAEQKQAMSDYFDQFGTLRGFKGKMPTVQDFYNAMEGKGETMSLPAGSNLQDAARAELDRRMGKK